jgi:hypothetical protein
MSVQCDLFRVISRRPQPPHSGGRMRGVSNFNGF